MSKLEVLRIFVAQWVESSLAPHIHGTRWHMPGSPALAIEAGESEGTVILGYIESLRAA